MRMASTLLAATLSSYGDSSPTVTGALSPEPEHCQQARIAERGDTADPVAGDGEHQDSVGLVASVFVTRVLHSGWLPVGASWQHAPVAWLAEDVLAEEGNARAAAGEPGAQRRRLQRDVREQQPLERRGVGVLERGDVPVEQCPGPRRVGF